MREQPVVDRSRGVVPSAVAVAAEGGVQLGPVVGPEQAQRRGQDFGFSTRMCSM